MSGATSVPTREQIAERAYALYLERGAESGHDVEDWLAAEKELSQEQEQYGGQQLKKREKAMGTQAGG